MRILTVAIPTYDRPSILRRTLEALTRVIVPRTFVLEVIVVQNCPTDETPAVVREFASRLPIRMLVEKRPGVNLARNAAIADSRGELIVFTDDDTEPDPNWLNCYAEAFDEFPSSDIFGGPITPLFPEMQPEWMAVALPEVASAYGRLERGARDITFSRDFSPFGANMAFRVAALKDAYFDGSVGPIGTMRINGAETELMLRLLDRGHKGRWVEGARVKHCIQPKHMTSRFLRCYYISLGAAMTEDWPDGTTMFRGRPRWLWREMVESELRSAVAKVAGRSDVWARELKRASIARGRLTGRGTTFA